MKEIRIFDSCDISSYFRFMPARVIDYSGAAEYENVAKMRDAEISVEEGSFVIYLSAFFFRYMDDSLKSNRCRLQVPGSADDGYISEFDWFSDNFYTFETMERLLTDMKDTMDALASGRENPYTTELKLKKDSRSGPGLCFDDNTGEWSIVHEFTHSLDFDPDMIIDFYRRFSYRMEYMMKVGKENGFDQICVLGCPEYMDEDDCVDFLNDDPDFFDSMLA